MFSGQLQPELLAMLYDTGTTLLQISCWFRICIGPLMEFIPSCGQRQLAACRLQPPGPQAGQLMMSGKQLLQLVQMGSRLSLDPIMHGRTAATGCRDWPHMQDKTSLLTCMYRGNAHTRGSLSRLPHLLQWPSFCYPSVILEVCAHEHFCLPCDEVPFHPRSVSDIDDGLAAVCTMVMLPDEGSAMVFCMFYYNF